MNWFVLGVFSVGVLLVILFAKPKNHAYYRSVAEKVHMLFLDGSLSGGRGLAYLRKVDPYVFEELVLDAFEQNGYKVKRNERYSGDGGIDGRVSHGRSEYCLQCKRYKRHIRYEHVEAFSKLCSLRGVRGFFVHTGKTGRKVRQALHSFGNVTVISGEKLCELLSADGDCSVV